MTFLLDMTSLCRFGVPLSPLWLVYLGTSFPLSRHRAKNFDQQKWQKDLAPSMERQQVQTLRKTAKGVENKFGRAFVVGQD